MALTPQQIQDLRKKYNLENTGNAGNNVAVKETAEQRIKRLRGGVPGKPENTLTTIVKGLVTPFARAGVNAYNTVSSVGTLGAAALAKLGGKDEQARQLVGQAGEEARKLRNVPFLGELAPVGGREGDSIFEGVKDITGTGLEIGSNLVGAGGAATAAKTGFRTALKEGVKTGVRVGAASGGAQAAGQSLEEDKGVLDTLQNILFGTALGAGAGAAFGAGGAAVSKAIEGGAPIVNKIRNRIPGMADEVVPPTPGAVPVAAEIEAAAKPPSLIDGVKENVLATYNKLKGARANSAINAQEKKIFRENFAKLDPVSQSSIRKGLLPRDVDLIKSSNPAQTNLNKKILTAAEEYEKLRGKSGSRPSAVVGEEFRKRITALKEGLGTANKELDEVVGSLKGQKLNTEETMKKVFQRLSEKEGLQGLTLNPDGTLNFARTTLSSKGSTSARKNVQAVFDDLIERADDPESMHLFRKELFEDLGGKKSSGIQLGKTEEEAVNAIRQGMADAIADVAPAYKDKNIRIAELLGFERRIRKLFGEGKPGSEDIFDAKAGSILRRLTSEAASGQDIAQVLQEVEQSLQNYGVKFDTNLTQTQEFLNLLNRYFDIASDTSLLGIIKTSLPLGKAELLQKVVNLVGENIQPTDATAKQAIKEMLEGAGKSVAQPAVPAAVEAAAPKLRMRKNKKSY